MKTEDLERTRDEFYAQLWSQHQSTKFGDIINIDETGVYYDIPPSKIIAERRQSARVVNTSNHSARMTAVLGVRADDMFFLYFECENLCQWSRIADALLCCYCPNALPRSEISDTVYFEGLEDWQNSSLQTSQLSKRYEFVFNGSFAQVLIYYM